MEPEPQSGNDLGKSSSLPPPSLPRPNLAPPPPSPVSPLDSPARASAPAPVAEPVKVNLKTAAPAEGAEASGADDRAPLNPRLIAFAIDTFLTLGIVVLAQWILPTFAEALGMLLGMAYLLVRDALPVLEGQSVGKKAMNLKAVAADGSSLSGNWRASILRNVLLLIPFFGFVELYVLLTRDDRPDRGFRIGDQMAKTRVVAIASDPAPAG